MAKIEILTKNANNDGWIDNVPGGVSTGYQAQNTNITARTLGMDLTSLAVAGSNITLSGGGVFDRNGVPYALTQDISFALSALSVGCNYIQIISGANSLEKDASLITIAPTWNPVKNYYETSSGNRVLNWIIALEAGEVRATRLNQGVKSIGDVVGLGQGSRRIFVEHSTHYVPIVSAGVYTIGGCGSGGRSVDPENPDPLSGYGSKGGRVRVRLEVGDTLEINVSAAPNFTSGVYCGAKLSASWGVDTAFATGSAILEEKHYSGGAPYIDEENGVYRAGGGAGMHGVGRPGSLYSTGLSFHGHIYGEGYVVSGTGYIEAYWEGE